MALTLGDISAAPDDPTELYKHLTDRGYLTPPPEPTPLVPPTQIRSAMSEVVPPTTVKPMMPPNVVKGPHAPDFTATDFLAHMAHGAPRAPLSPVNDLEMTQPEMGGQPTAQPDMGVKPMTPPTLTHAEKMALPMTSAGVPDIGSAAYTRNELERMQEQKAQKPQGFWQNLGHVAGRAANIAGDILAPGITAAIPGSDLNKQVQEHQLKRELASRTAAEGQEAERQARTGLEKQRTESEIGLQGAQKEHAEAETEQVGKPQGDEAKAVHDLMTGGDNGQPQINPATNKPYSYLEAYGAAKKAGEKTPEAEKPLGAAGVAQMSQALQERYHVLNPNKPLPPAYQLGPNATQGDYDRLDKSLEATEKATMTKTQLEALAEQRRMAREDKNQQKLDKEEKEGRDWVSGEDPNTGKQVLVPLAQAKELGLKNQAKADNDTLNKTLAARHVEPLLYNNDPANPGIMQMIDKLDKEGHLGPLATRWNDFMARKWGGDDPEYAALRARMDLATTKLMQAHVGSRGGAFMLEHFEDIANAKKMSAANLRAGVDQELRYVNDISMNAPKTKPKEAAAAPQGGAQATGTPKVGEVRDGYKFKGGDWHQKSNWEKQKK